MGAAPHLNRIGLVAIAAAPFASGAAYADDIHLRLSLAGCPSLAVKRIAELAAPAVRVGLGTGGTEISGQCEGKVLRVLARGSGGNVVSRAVPLGDDPRDSERLIALLLAEWAAALAEPVTAPSPADKAAEPSHRTPSEKPAVAHAVPVPVPVVAPTPAVRPELPPAAPVLATVREKANPIAALSAPARLDPAPRVSPVSPWFESHSLSVQGGIESLVAELAPAPSIGVRWNLDLKTSPLGFSIGGTYVRGQVPLAAGQVAFETLSALALIQARRDWGRLQLRGGLGLRGGAASLQGAPGSELPRGEGHALSGPWAGAMALTSVCWALTDSLGLELGAEGGQIVSPVRGRVLGQQLVGVMGSWAAVQLGVIWRFQSKEF